MTAYRIDQATGALQPMADYEVGQSPFWVMVATLEF
jgi:6-phosphogluconolactonase (cycloisomerase 2 family)